MFLIVKPRNSENHGPLYYEARGPAPKTWIMTGRSSSCPNYHITTSLSLDHKRGCVTHDNFHSIAHFMFLIVKPRNSENHGPLYDPPPWRGKLAIKHSLLSLYRSHIRRKRAVKTPETRHLPRQGGLERVRYSR
jgi:hypothetical protein